MIFDTGAMSTPRTRKTPRARKTRTRTKDPVQKVLPGGALELRFAVTGMSAFLLTVVCSNHYYRTWIVDDVAPRPPRRNRQVSVVKVVDPEAQRLHLSHVVWPRTLGPQYIVTATRSNHRLMLLTCLLRLSVFHLL